MRNSKLIRCLLTFVFCSWSQSNAWPFGFGDSTDGWEGKWFPQPDGQADTNELVDYLHTRNDLHDDRHGVIMGIPAANCDDGKTHLEQDWLDNIRNYTCFRNKNLYLPRYDVNPIFIADHIPPYYSARHECMDHNISYDTNIPTFGTHRPLWAKYGEYKFLPKQRWVHNLEHGAVVMLYHPCANKAEVNFLRNLVEHCLYRYVITPYNLMSSKRPLALVTWGKKLLMSKVDPTMVQEFIIKFAKHGPEQILRDGQYDYGLLKHAAVVTTEADDVLCPNYSAGNTIA